MVLPSKAYTRLLRHSCRFGSSPSCCSSSFTPTACAFSTIVPTTWLGRTTTPLQRSSPSPSTSTSTPTRRHVPRQTMRQHQWQHEFRQCSEFGTTSRTFSDAEPVTTAAKALNVTTPPPDPTSENTQQISGIEPPDYLSESELQVFQKLKRELEPSKLEVQDISGGCGSMYGLDIVSSKFKGLNVVQQHKLVNQVLKAELKSWHGVQLKTKAA